MFTIKDIDQKTVEAKLNLRLDWIAAVLFAIPVFMVVSPGYLTMLTVISVIIIGFAALASVFMTFNLLNDKTITGKFFTIEQILSWIVVGIILTSMFILQMDPIFAIYLILVAANNAMKYMLLKKPVDIIEDF